MKNILLAFATIACLFGAKSLLASDIFTIENIVIEESGESSSDAKNNGINKAKQDAFKTILQKLLTSSDFADATKKEIETGEINALISSMQISNEQTSPTKYKAKIAVSFGPTLLGKFLKEKSYKFIADTPANTLLIPVVVAANNAVNYSATDSLIKELNRIKSKPENIIPVQFPTIASKSTFNAALESNMEKINKLNDTYDSTSVIIAKISPSNEAIEVMAQARLDIVKTDTGSSKGFNIVSNEPESIYETIATAIIRSANDLYKKDIIDNKGASGELTAVFTIKSISDMLRIEKTLSGIKYISGTFKKAVSPQMIQVALKTKTNKKTIIQALSSKGFSIQDMNTYIIARPLN